MILTANNKTKRIVSHKVVDDTHGSLYLGAYPNDILNGNLSFAKIGTNGDDWSLKATYVKFGNEYKQLSDGHKLGNDSVSYDIAYIAFDQKVISAPQYLLKYFLTTYFKDTGDYTNATGGNCTVTGVEVTTISCPAAVYRNVSWTSIFFAFGDDAAFSVNATNLFTLNGNNYDFNIQFTNVTGFNRPVASWSFGSVFTKNYITVLSADESNIGFYGAGVVNGFSGSSTKILIVIVVVGIAIIILAIAFLYCYCKKKNEDGYVAH
jgi:hypothetical protein